MGDFAALLAEGGAGRGSRRGPVPLVGLDIRRSGSSRLRPARAASLPPGPAVDQPALPAAGKEPGEGDVHALSPVASAEAAPVSPSVATAAEGSAARDDGPDISSKERLAGSQQSGRLAGEPILRQPSAGSDRSFASASDQSFATAASEAPPYLARRDSLQHPPSSPGVSPAKLSGINPRLPASSPPTNSREGSGQGLHGRPAPPTGAGIDLDQSGVSTSIASGLPGRLHGSPQGLQGAGDGPLPPHGLITKDACQSTGRREDDVALAGPQVWGNGLDFRESSEDNAKLECNVAIASLTTQQQRPAVNSFSSLADLQGFNGGEATTLPAVQTLEGPDQHVGSTVEVLVASGTPVDEGFAGNPVQDVIPVVLHKEHAGVGVSDVSAAPTELQSAHDAEAHRRLNCVQPTLGSSGIFDSGSPSNSYCHGIQECKPQEAASQGPEALNDHACGRSAGECRQVHQPGSSGGIDQPDEELEEGKQVPARMPSWQELPVTASAAAAGPGQQSSLLSDPGPLKHEPAPVLFSASLEAGIEQASAGSTAYPLAYFWCQDCMC